MLNFTKNNSGTTFGNRSLSLANSEVLLQIINILFIIKQSYASQHAQRACAICRKIDPEFSRVKIESFSYCRNRDQKHLDRTGIEIRQKAFSRSDTTTIQCQRLFLSIYFSVDNSNDNDNNDNGERGIDSPCVWLRYCCQTKNVSIGITWLHSNDRPDGAQMFSL